MIEENLKKIGFRTNEIKIYLTLFRLGKTKAGELIKETSLQRSVVYSGLEELLARSLVSKSVSKGVAVYTANDPEALVDEIEQKALLAKKVSKELQENRAARDREALVYEGEDIVKRISDKSLDGESGSTVYFLGPSKFGVQSHLERYWQYYHKKRIEKGIYCKLLYDKSTSIEVLDSRNKLELCEARYLPLDTEVPMSFVITDDSVGMIIPAEQPPLALLTKSSITAEAMKKYFDYLWKQSEGIK